MATFDEQHPFMHTSPNRVGYYIKVAIGAVGAVGAISGSYGFAVTRTGAGSYSLTFPKSVDMTMGAGTVEGTPATGAPHASVTTLNPSAGTAAVVTRNLAGVATDPTSGSILQIAGTIQYKAI